MTDPMKFGFRPEPANPKHFEYETLLKPRMASFASYNDRDLREFSPNDQRHNQQSTSSCTANGVTKALEIRRNLISGGKNFVPLSRLAIYYLARELMRPSETDRDAGTYVSLACDVLRRFGVCPESEWPFEPAKINMAPPWSAMRRAYIHKITSFYKIHSTGKNRVAEVARCIQAGLPVVFGTQIGSQWNGYRGNLTQMAPLTVPENPGGGHCTVLIGTMNGTFIGENSWGNGWGDLGFYRMDPKVIASDLSSDFWVMENSNDPWTQGKPEPAKI